MTGSAGPVIPFSSRVLALEEVSGVTLTRPEGRLLVLRSIVELPRGCSYWHDPRMCDFLGKQGFSYADFDGCMYGLVARHGPETGHPICKPWRIACLNSSLNTFLFKMCDSKDALGHAKCGGQNTKETQCYTTRIADMIHKSLKHDVRALKGHCYAQSVLLCRRFRL